MNAMTYGPIDVATRVCPVCNGNGEYYFAKFGEKGTKVQVTGYIYQLLPRNAKEAREKNSRFYRYRIEKCECCGGEGVIEEYI